MPQLYCHVPSLRVMVMHVSWFEESSALAVLVHAVTDNHHEDHLEGVMKVSVHSFPAEAIAG
jgi:aromatic ring-cleaving dioxygenase